VSLDKPRLADTRPALDIESIIGETEPAETAVTICVKGSLRAEYERLDAQLGGITQAVTNLAGEGPGTAIVARMDELREQMREFERTFVLRAVTPRRAWRNVRARMPVKQEGQNEEDWADLYHPWVCEVVSKSAASPEMTPEQVERLADRLSDGDWSKLAAAAWSVNDDSSSIPFSVAASAITLTSGGKQRRQEISENPAHGSLAGSPDPSPSTSTTSKAVKSGQSPRANRSGSKKTATSS
jgi:hypothetical protein